MIFWAVEQNFVNEMFVFENSVMEEKRKRYQIITDSELTFDSHVKNLQFSAEGLFKYVWPFSGYQALKA